MVIRASVLLLVSLPIAACSRTPPSAAVTSASSAPAPSAAAPPTSRPSDVVKTSSGDVRITPLHHGSLLLDFAGKAIYFDPTKDVDYAGLPKAAAIFVTDIHGDHMDPPAIEKLSDAETVIVAPPAVAEKLPKSIPHVFVMKNGERTAEKSFIVPHMWSLGVEAVPMYNKVRGPSPGHLFHDKGRGNGYVLSFGDKRFYVSGDTECTDEMKALKDIDVAFVCMNLPYTMPPSEAAECVAAFQPKIVYPYHYRGSDVHELEKALAGKPIEVRLRSWY